eukprot:480217-Rhodomonas_salina.1
MLVAKALTCVRGGRRICRSETAARTPHTSTSLPSRSSARHPAHTVRHPTSSRQTIFSLTFLEISILHMLPSLQMLPSLHMLPSCTSFLPS